MKKLLNICVLFLTVTGLTSCLDEDPFFNPDAVENVIEIQSAGNVQSPVTAVHPLFVNSFDIAPEAEMPIVISYSGADVAPTDIVVTLAVDNTALDRYNEDQFGADHEDEYYVPLDEDLYTLPTTVTIPKGQRRATYTVKLNTDQFDFEKKYALGLRITETSHGIISGNFNTAVFAVGAKNEYDGNYTVTATAPMVDVTNATLTGYYPLDADLVTTGPRSVVMFTYTLLGGLEGHPIRSGTAGSYYGSFAPIFTMDGEGNVTSVTNFYGEPAGNGRAARLNPDGVNKFTMNADGSKTLEVSYIMVQGGADRTFFHERWTFEGAR